MRALISILLNIDDYNVEAKLMQIQTNLEMCNIDYNLAIYNNGDNELVNSFAADQKVKTYLTGSKINVCNSEAYNALLKEVETQFICILPVDVFCQSNWLYDLLYYNNKIERSGITAISIDLSKGYMHSFLNDEGKLTIAYTNEKNAVYGPVLFSNSIVSELGAFNTDYHSGDEIIEYCYRASKIGRYNYYIKEQNAIDLGAFESVWKTSPEHIEKIENNPVFIQLHQMTANQKAAWYDIDQLVDKMSYKSKKLVNNSTSNFGIASICFKKEDLTLIEEYADKYELAYSIVNPSSYTLIKVVFFNP